jgi:hypothetical protein|tara:strand:+ start:930 stop:1694 length:765 start_codon:yes stop_codon:yes gene_type:complete
MAVPLAGMFMPALAKVGALKLPTLLRAAGVTAGAAPSLMRGDLGGAVIGGGLGALGTLGLGSTATNLGTRAGMKAAQMAGGEGLKATAAGILGRAAVPVAGGLAAGGLAAGIGGRPVSNVAQGAAGLAGYGAVGGEGMGGVPLPPGMGPYGNIGPSGLPLDVLSPLGLEAGRRLRTQKDAESLRDATNIVLPTLRKFSEQAKRDDFARSMAARGIAQNIQTNAALTQGMAAAARQMGTQAAQQAGAALTQQYRY